jgi:hypothetical protein
MRCVVSQTYAGINYAGTNVAVNVRHKIGIDVCADTASSKAVGEWYCDGVVLKDGRLVSVVAAEANIT